MEKELKKINEEITEQIKALQTELKYKYVKRTGTSGDYTYWYKNPKTGKLEAGAKPSGAKQQTRKEDMERAKRIKEKIEKEKQKKKEVTKQQHKVGEKVTLTDNREGVVSKTHGSFTDVKLNDGTVITTGGGYAVGIKPLKEETEKKSVLDYIS